MKTKTTLSKTILIFILLFAVVRANAIEIQLSPTMYAGGYNISCHGSNNGAINTYVLDGTGPFTFVWSNGATSKNISNLTAGAYTVTVTASNGETAIGQIDLIEPELFIADLTPEDKGNGYQISEFGGTDGNIHSQITGGVPPYNFLWSNGATTEAIDNLTEGTYTVVVHDATNCITTATVTLLEPTELHLVSITSPKVIGNYNIGCSLPGSISVNIAGGIPPYIYEWENGGNTQTLNDLFDEGDYGVLVRDENGAEVRTNIILTRSPVLSASVSAFVYSNNKNTSCYNCNNGSINTTISSGTSPYTFVWNNGASVKNPNNLSAGVYSVIISDAAGCTTEKTAILMAPEREDWTMNGNTGTNPATQYIGTIDNKDLVFKRMNIETMRFDTSGTSFEKLLTAKNGIALNAAQTFKITYDNTGTETTVSYGSKSPVILPCSQVPVYGTINEFPGSLKTWADVIGGTNKSSLLIGSAPWNGSGLIELNGTNESGNPNVLTINYFCGRNVAICTNNDAGGVVSTGRHFEVGGPYPPNNPLIAANIRGTSQTGLKVHTMQDPLGGPIPVINTQLSVNEQNTKIIGGFLQNSNNDKEIFSINGDGETRFGGTVVNGVGTQPTIYFSSSFDGATNNFKTGNIGIGTQDPHAQLQVGNSLTSVSMGSFMTGTPAYTSNYIGFNAARDGNITTSDKWTLSGGNNCGNGAAVIAGSLNGDLHFISIASSAIAPTTMTDDGILQNEKMVIKSDGKIGIGNPLSYPGNYNLYVTGGVLTEKLKIALGSSTEWMDKVFDKEYKLKTLDELESYIKKNKHLPEIPTTSEVQNEGIDIGTMVAKLLQKNEELTLYVIQINKENNALKERVQLLEITK